MFKNLFLLALLAVSAGLPAATAPDFTITDSNGNAHHLYADYVNQGKVVVLEIFFTTCPPCATHAPYWQALYESVKTQYPGQVEFIMLSDKSADNNALVAQYKISKGLTMVAAGSEGGSLAAVQPYKNNLFGPFYGTPTFVIITPGSGAVDFDVRGNSPAGTMDSIAQKVSQLLLPACRINTHQGDTLQAYNLNVQVPGGAAFHYQVSGGKFSLEQFAGLPPVPFYQVTPSKTNDPLNGVSTFDLLQINKQILGVELFTAPWQFVAADANNSGTISTFDIVELRKLILGVYDSLPNAPSWVFQPPMDTLSPLECPAFFAIKKGDVNGNANAANLLAASDRTGYAWPIWVENKTIQAGQTVDVPIYSAQAGQWLGMQMGWRFDPAALELISVSAMDLPGFADDAWHETPGRLAVSWLTGAPVHIPAGSKTLTLRFRALQEVQLTNALRLETAPLRAEVYDSEGGIHAMQWQPIDRLIPAAMLAPNPAREWFSLWVADEALLGAPVQLIDTQGRVVFEQICNEMVMEIRPGWLAPGLYAVFAQGQLLGKLLWQD